MLSSIQNVLNLYNEVENLSDPRVRKWFLMNSLLIPISIITVYLYFILVFGPRMMKNRKPFHINKIILFYNTIQVIFNACLFIFVSQYVWKNLHSFTCFKVDYTDTENAHQARWMNWLFTINKLLDLLDTVFFVLKKKPSHVTFLHVYHHILTFGCTWGFAKYYPGGQLVVIGLLNSFVHCVMYSYYLLSLVRRLKTISSFIKKRITQMQILQFVLAGMHGAYGLTDETCDYPKGLIYFGLSQAVLMIILFVDFYRKAYLRNTQKKIHPQNGHIRNGISKKID